MADKDTTKITPNSELYQARVQMLKEENIKKQWHEKWSWIIDEQDRLLEDTMVVLKEKSKFMPVTHIKEEDERSLKPIPQTSTGAVGWLSARNEWLLDKYPMYAVRIPVRLPDVWETPEYYENM